MRPAVALALLLLSGCVGMPSPASRGVCPVVIDLPADLQGRFYTEMDALPAGFDNLRWAIIDWIRMRDEARAICGTERFEARE